MGPTQQRIGREHHDPAERGPLHSTTKHEITAVEHNPTARIRAVQELAQEELVESVTAAHNDKFNVFAVKDVRDTKESGLLCLRRELPCIGAHGVMLTAC